MTFFPNLLRQLLPKVVNMFVQLDSNQILRRVWQWLGSFYERVKLTARPRRCSRDDPPKQRTPVRGTQLHTRSVVPSLFPRKRSNLPKALGTLHSPLSKSTRERLNPRRPDFGLLCDSSQVRSCSKPCQYARRNNLVLFVFAATISSSPCWPAWCGWSCTLDDLA